MKYGGGYSDGSAAVGEAGQTIIKFQIDITLQRFNGVLWLRASFATGFSPRLATTVTVCDFSIPNGGLSLLFAINASQF